MLLTFVTYEVRSFLADRPH